MTNRAQAMVLASFAADALAVGVHWVYDTDALALEYGRVETFLKPSPGSYHASKACGDFTHYGDQAAVLLESVSAKRGFDLDDFSGRWRAMFDHYSGYMDRATRDTLAGYAAGRPPDQAGSYSEDLAGAARIAPLILAEQRDLDRLVQSVRSQTAMTHHNRTTIDAAEFFARSVWWVLNGVMPTDAVRQVAMDHFEGAALSRWVRVGLESVEEDSVAAIGRFGRSCHTAEAFPGVIHLLAKYEDDLKEAVIQAVMAGGDNAARAMAVGMILGAHLGWEAIPPDWTTGLSRREQILSLMSSL